MHLKRTFLFSYLIIFSTMGCGQMNRLRSENYQKIQEEVPDSIYPPSTYFPSYVTAWTQIHYPERINQFKATPLIKGGIVFIGNSITELAKDWSVRFGVNGIQNRGIAGDVTEGVLARLGEIGYFKPNAVFLLIGINDIFRGKTSDFIAGNIVKIANSIHLRTPYTKIYVQTILPTSSAVRIPVIAATNQLLKLYAAENNYSVIDLHALFADSNDIIQTAYTTDGTHLSEAGYGVWVAAEKDLITTITASQPITSDDTFILSQVGDKLIMPGLDIGNKYTCEIYNMEGKRMLSTVVANDNELDVSRLLSNRYILKIFNQVNSWQFTSHFQKL